MTAPLDAVRDRIDRQLQIAMGSISLSHLGLWLGVFDVAQPWSQPDGLRKYSGVAEAAMVTATNGGGSARRYFAEGLDWLQRRRFFVPGQPRGLEADPLACIQLAVGIRVLGDSSASQWISGIAERAAGEERDVRRAAFFKLARAIASGADAPWGEVSPVMSVACARTLRRQVTAVEHQKAFGEVMSLAGIEPELALFHEAALRAVFAIEATVDLARPTVEQVVSLLRGIPAALKRWPWEDAPRTHHRGVTSQRWDVQHEYHAQSLVWAVLRPVFPGLEDEENLPSLGPKHPRADLLIPGLRLVVEIKFLREATQSSRAKVIEEIAADASMYRTENSGYETIVAVVWDATGSSNHHAEIEAGLRRLPGVADVVIISRPGGWK